MATKQPYDKKADIWSLGITAIEMAEGAPPNYNARNIIRTMLMIPNKPPPTLAEPDKWSKEFNNFIAACLCKDPKERPTSKELLGHPFIKNAKYSDSLLEKIRKYMKVCFSLFFVKYPFSQ